MRHRFNVLRISLRAMLVLVALCAIGLKWHREIRDFGRDLLFYPWYRLDDGRLGADASGRFFELVAFSPDGKTLATVGKNRGEATLAVWDVPARCLSWEAKLGKAYIAHLLFSADGKTVVIIDTGPPMPLTIDPPIPPANAIRWDAVGGRRLSTTRVNESTVIWSSALSPDGNTLAVGSGNLTLRDLRSGATIGELDFGASQIGALAYAPDGRSVAMERFVFDKSLNEWRGELTILDSTTLRPKASLFKDGEHVRFLVFSGDGSTLASAHKGGIVRLWDAKSWQLRKTIDDPILSHRQGEIFYGEPLGGMSSLAISRDGNILATGLGYNQAWLWDGKTGQRRNFIRTSGGNSLSFGAGGRTLAFASGSENESTLVLDLETGREVDLSSGVFPNRKTAYWVAGFCLTAATVFLMRVKRKRRARNAASIAKSSPNGAKRRLSVFVLGVGFAVLALLVAGVLIRRASYAHRLAAAIDALGADPAEKAAFKNFVAQAVVSPRCARLLEHLDLQFLRDDKTKKFVMTNILANLVFRSRYRDERGRGREVFVFRVKYSVSSRAGLQTVVITDDWGRVLSWKELGETIYFDSADLERVGDRNILAIYNEQAGYRSIYRCDLSDDEIRPIRVEPFPSRKIMDALARINHINMDMSLNPKLGNTVNFSGGTQTDDELAALADTLDVLGGVKTLYLARSRITGAGLVRLKTLSSLKELDLQETAVDDAGLAHLSGLVNLETLDLSSTKVVGPGLKALRGLRKLKVLKLKGCPIKEKDLEPLRGLPNLKEIVVDAATR